VNSLSHYRNIIHIPKLYCHLDFSDLKPRAHSPTFESLSLHRQPPLPSYLTPRRSDSAYEHSPFSSTPKQHLQRCTTDSTYRNQSREGSMFKSPHRQCPATTSSISQTAFKRSCISPKRTPQTDITPANFNRLQKTNSSQTICANIHLHLLILSQNPSPTSPTSPTTHHSFQTRRQSLCTNVHRTKLKHSRT